MNLLQVKSNQYLRDAILEGSVDKTRRYLTLKIGKADVGALTESGGFTMLHCASIVGNTQIVMMLLQFGADVLALTDDGYTALDLAIWRGHLQIMELLRSQGCIAPMKEPESLNGRVVSHLGRRATVVFFEPSTAIRTRSLRALHYEDKGEAKLVHLWAGTDYKIVGVNPYYEELKAFEYQLADVPLALPQQYDAMLQGQAFFDNDSDSESENEIDEVVEVRVPPGPLGVLLDSGIQECAVVHGFTNLPAGGKGPIETHGQVQPGMYIIGINEHNASLMSLQEVTQLLGKLARKDKVIRFATFRPGSPRRHGAFTDDEDEDDSDDDDDEEDDAFGGDRSSAATDTASTASSTLPPPVPVTATGFASRFASLAQSVLDKKPSTAEDEAECAHCGMPSAAHRSADCPYK
jgi:hypothetical protein